MQQLLSYAKSDIRRKIVTKTETGWLLPLEIQIPGEFLEFLDENLLPNYFTPNLQNLPNLFNWVGFEDFVCRIRAMFVWE